MIVSRPPRQPQRPKRRDMVDYLKSFQPRCIALGEDTIQAHRYAAQVELAQYILALIESGEPDLTYEED